MSRNWKEHRGIASTAIRRPIGTLMLVSVILVLGLFFLRGLPLDLLPSIVYPNLRANVSNRGVEPQVLEETVAKPLESALATTENVTRMETEVREGSVGVNLTFAYGTDVDFALQDAAKNLERARGALPDEADAPTIFKFDPSQSPIYDVAFSSATRDLVSLRDWVEYRLQPQLLTIEGVASVDISGGLVREIQVTLDQERLRSYGLTVSQVIDAVRSANQDVAAGRITSPTRELVGKTAGKFRSVKDVETVLLPVRGGGRVPLTEVASVRDTHREQRLWARLDGVQAVRMTIRKQPNANTVTVAEGVDARLKNLGASQFIPGDIKYQVISNQADFIRNSVNSVSTAALMGAGLAMLVVFLFLASLRKTLIIGLAIPLAIMAAFALMGASHLTLNIMSLGGLALGVGMLVDNSIVMLENIFRHKEEGNEDVEDAAHEGANEVTSPVIASTLTNLAAVVPFLLISGLAALIFRELILTISFAILASLGVALTLVPMLAAQLGKVRFSSGINRWKPLVAVDNGMRWLRGFYRRIAPPIVHHPWTVLGSAVLLLFGASFLIRGLGSQFLPQVDDGNVGVMIRLQPGASAEQTNVITLEIEDMVRKMPGVVSQFATAGGMGFGGSTSETAGRGNISIVLAGPKERGGMTAGAWVQQLQDRIDARGFPGARISVRPPSIRGLRTNMAGSDVAITITGDDLNELRAIGEEIMLRTRGIPGLEQLNPSADEASPQLAVELDRERASYLGLNVATVGQTLRTALDGTIATRFTSGNQEYDLRVRLPREEFATPEDVGSVALFPGSTGGQPIYLRDVARVYTTLGPTTILRENQNRVFRLTGEVLDDIASVGEVNDSIRGRLAGIQLADGYGLVYGGEEEAIRENNRQLTIVVVLAIFLVFVVMAVQYESFVNPFVIITAIPLSLIGVCVLLFLTRTTLSAPVLLGIILLAGIVVNNAILLVEYTEQGRREHGYSRERAVVEAGAVRLRPILMTTLTTVFGRLPLALGSGQGSELMQPLAIAVVGGMSISTLLTLFVVPSAYLIFNTAAERALIFLTGRRPAAPQGAEASQPAAVGAD
ncbi:MAG: efflux RND transporter permease subunit [Gemmatimonadetes bacterium]|nr:efflux RND transporter permease subunit [Gemmatimonadota bacterium]